MVKSYIPDRGDIVWVNFDPTVGHEQAKLRPALVITPKFYNSKSGIAMVCPVTSQVRDFPFEVRVNDKKVTGVIRVDHTKSIDWKARKVKFIAKANKAVVMEVRDILLSLISE